MPANLKPQSKDYITRLSAQVDTSINQTAKRVADKMQPYIQSGDGQNVKTSDWHQMIRQNWGDPQWRAQHAFRMGPVKLVQDALQAFGLKPGLLADNAEALTLGLNQHGNDANAAVQQAGTADVSESQAPDIQASAPFAANQAPPQQGM